MKAVLNRLLRGAKKNGVAPDRNAGRAARMAETFRCLQTKEKGFIRFRQFVLDGLPHLFIRHAIPLCDRVFPSMMTHSRGVDKKKLLRKANGPSLPMQGFFPSQF